LLRQAARPVGNAGLRHSYVRRKHAHGDEGIEVHTLREETTGSEIEGLFHGTECVQEGRVKEASCKSARVRKHGRRAVLT
jgi:hypothetical protein